MLVLDGLPKEQGVDFVAEAGFYEQTNSSFFRALQRVASLCRRQNWFQTTTLLQLVYMTKSDCLITSTCLPLRVLPKSLYYSSGFLIHPLEG